MRGWIKNFIRNKFNIALCVIELIAIVLFVISAFGVSLCVVLAIMMQGVACIVWGIKCISRNSDITFNQQYYDELPYAVEYKKAIRKTDERDIKNNKFTGWIVIILGVILIGMCFPLL